MGQSTISMAIFNSKLLVYQRVRYPSLQDFARCFASPLRRQDFWPHLFRVSETRGLTPGYHRCFRMPNVCLTKWGTLWLFNIAMENVLINGGMNGKIIYFD